MDSSRIDLVNRGLPRAFRGYSRPEVDRLLQDLSDALARTTDDKVTLAAKLADAEERLKEFKARETALQDALVAGRRMSEDIRASAQKEAQLVLDTARVKAEALLQNANVRLARVLEEIEDAKKAKIQFEMKLKAVIEGHLRLLELERQETEALEDGLAKAALSGAAAGAEPGNGGK